MILNKPEDIKFYFQKANELNKIICSTCNETYKTLEEFSKENSDIKEVAALIKKSQIFEKVNQTTVSLYKSQDFKGLFKVFSLAAELGHTKSMYNLGNFYLHGYGVVEKDTKKSKDWWMLAAEAGDINAQFNLGAFYQQEKQYEQAMHLFKASADQGYSASQNAIGLMYIHGQGVEKSFKEAKSWFEKAAALGHEDAKDNLKRTILRLATDTETPEAKKDFELGRQYYYEKNYQLALHYCLKAAVLGHKDAECQIAIMYTFGLGVEKDSQQALFWYKKAAEHGQADAQNNLGALYQAGEEVDKDIKTAIYWLQLAAEQDHSQAQYTLGLIYFEEKEYFDLRKAKYWSSQAFKNGKAEAKEFLMMLDRTLLEGEEINDIALETVEAMHRKEDFIGKSFLTPYLDYAKITFDFSEYSLEVLDDLLILIRNDIIQKESSLNTIEQSELYPGLVAIGFYFGFTLARLLSCDIKWFRREGVESAIDTSKFAHETHISFGFSSSFGGEKRMILPLAYILSDMFDAKYQGQSTSAMKRYLSQQDGPAMTYIASTDTQEDLESNELWIEIADKTASCLNSALVSATLFTTIQYNFNWLLSHHNVVRDFSFSENPTQAAMSALELASQESYGVYISDVFIYPPTGKTSAIFIRIQSVDGLDLAMMIPYEIINGNQVRFYSIICSTFDQEKTKEARKLVEIFYKKMFAVENSQFKECFSERVFTSTRIPVKNTDISDKSNDEIIKEINKSISANNSHNAVRMLNALEERADKDNNAKLYLFLFEQYGENKNSIFYNKEKGPLYLLKIIAANGDAETNYNLGKFLINTKYLNNDTHLQGVKKLLRAQAENYQPAIEMLENLSKPRSIYFSWFSILLVISLYLNPTVNFYCKMTIDMILNILFGK
jgi:TPR repeat protein